MKIWGGGHDTGGGGIISKKAAYVPGGKGICGCDFIALDNPRHCFWPGHLGARARGGSEAGGPRPWLLSSPQQLAGARRPRPTMPSSKTGSEYWIDGSHRETALEDFYIMGPELGRYRLPEGGVGRGWWGAGALLPWEWVLIRAETRLVGRGRDGEVDEGMERWMEGCRKGLKGGWRDGGMQEGMEWDGGGMKGDAWRGWGWDGLGRRRGG